MRARWNDPQGARWVARTITWLGAALFAAALAVGMSGPRELDRPAVAGLVVGAALAMLGPLLAWRRRPADVRLLPVRGCLAVRGNGVRAKLRARRIRGASTAFTSDGRVALTVDVGRPVTLELEDAGDADRVREALGVGHDGFGNIVVPAGNTGSESSEAVGRILAGGGALVAFAAGGLGAPQLGLLAMTGAVLGFTILVIAWGFRISAALQGVRLDARGVTRLNPHVPIPWQHIVRAVDERGDVVLELADGRRAPLELGGSFPGSRGPTPEQRAHLVAQILAGAARARGLGAARSMQVVEVVRRHGAPLRAWLNRLDALASQLASSTAYRGAAVAAGDLWAALVDPDADVDVRLGAARILARSSPDEGTRRRIESIAVASRDRALERRFAEVLASELDEAPPRLDDVERGELLPEAAETQDRAGH